jgi:hypothetical protein
VEEIHGNEGTVIINYCRDFRRDLRITLFGVYGRMVNESGAGGEMRIGRETEIHKENPPQCHTLYHKSYIT